MTASTPPLVDVIAKSLARCDVIDHGVDMSAAYYQHRARAVLDALTTAGGVEWGTRDNERPNLLWVLGTKEAAEKETARFPDFRETVSRITGPWAAVEG